MPEDLSNKESVKAVSDFMVKSHEEKLRARFKRRSRKRNKRLVR